MSLVFNPFPNQIGAITSSPNPRRNIHGSTTRRTKVVSQAQDISRIPL